MPLARSIAGSLLNTVVYAALLFGPAGTLNWWQAWVALGLVLAAMLVTRSAMGVGGDALLAERRKSPLQHGQPPADKALVIAFLIVFPAFVACIPTDVYRLHLLARPEPVICALGLAGFVAGLGVVGAVFRTNTFAVGIVKDQTERGQTVVDAGPYAVVRHPMYAGVILALVGLALWLGSYAAALASVVPVAVLIARIAVEEAFLRSHLIGYADYARRVRRRLIPRIW